MALDRDKLKEVFADAIERSVEDRLSFVEAACGDDVELKDEVISLLGANDSTVNLIEANLLDLAKGVGAEPAVPVERKFGNYRILSEIGHGGMGSVFLATRDDGQFTMQVALKIVRQSIADTEIIERFKRERQILAGLKHPNIANLYDGGVSEKGEPFLAMEYVDGRTLNRYAAENDLSIDQRLSLFLKICNAVSFAHRNLVVHRDIKPANILVTNDGEPKLLDFGLARTFESDGSSTQTTLRAFTPAYASPEQILGQNLTTATDVYSLGVVFYEFISGEKPFKVDGLGYDQLVQTLTNFTPAAPSQLPDTAVTNLPHRALKGDLDNIALMAIRKEPERRYASVAAFADDIRAHIDGRPISARPNTFGYLAHSFVRRNKVAVGAALLITVAVLAGLGIALWQANVARRETARSDAVNRFMQQMLLTADPSVSGGGKRGAQATIIDILKQAEARIDNGELATEPEVRAVVRQLIGEGYQVQGLYADAERALTAAYEEQSKLHGDTSPAALQSELDLASLYLAKAEYKRSDEIFSRRYAQFRSEFTRGRLEPQVFAIKLNDYGVAARATGNTAVAEAMVREALDVATANALTSTVDGSRNLLVLILLDQGRFEEARTAQQTMVDGVRQKGDDAGLCAALTLFGSIQMESGDLVAAMTSLQEAEGIYRRLFGTEATPLYDNLRLQTQAEYQQGSYAEASEKIEVVLAQYAKNSSKKYISYATALTIKGLILNKLGRHSEAESVLREAMQLRRENLPPEHFMTALTEGALGEVLTDERKFDEAELLLRASLTSLETSQKAENPRLAMARSRLERLVAIRSGR